MVASNTGENRTDGRFSKGDPRINRKGRPKSFDKLRELAQSLADEQATTANGQPIVIDGHIATQAEMILRTLMKDNPERFLEIGYGKVPTPVDVTVREDDIDGAIERELARLAAGRKGKNAGAAAPEADDNDSEAVA